MIKKLTTFMCLSLILLSFLLIGCVPEKGTTPAGSFFEGFKGLVDNPLVTAVTSVVPGGGIIMGSLSAGLGLLAANERRKAKQKDIALDDVIEATNDLKAHVLPQDLEQWKKDNDETYDQATKKEVTKRKTRKRKAMQKVVGQLSPDPVVSKDITSTIPSDVTTTKTS